MEHRLSYFRWKNRYYDFYGWELELSNGQKYGGCVNVGLIGITPLILAEIHQRIADVLNLTPLV